MMDEVARLTPHLPTIVPTQGSYNGGGVAASAGTHDGGGAIDVSVDNMSDAQRQELVLIMRQVGWAAWLRTPSQGFAYHVHGIATGCPDLSTGAANQVRDYINGLNGLAGKGRDDGPRGPWVGRTFEEWQALQPPPPPPFIPREDDDMPPTVFVIINDKGEDTGARYLGAAGAVWQPVSASGSEANGWHVCKLTAREWEQLYARHCAKARLNPATYLPV